MQLPETWALPIAGLGRVSILADDLTGAADACAPLAEAGGAGRVRLSVTADGAEGSILAFDGDLRQLDEARARRVMAAFAAIAGEGERADGFAYLKVDSATRGHLVRDVSLALEAMPRFRGAVVAPAYPANGRLFRNGSAVIGGQEAASSLRDGFVGAGYRVALLDDLSGGADAVEGRIEAAFANGSRVVLVDSLSHSDLQRLAPVLVRRRSDVLSVGSAGLIEAIAGTRGAAVPLPRDQLTCIFGTRAGISRQQLDTLERRAGAIRFSRRPQEWRAIRDGQFSAAYAAAMEACLPRIIDIEASAEERSAESPVRSLAGAVAPYMDRMGVVLLSGGDTARAVLERLGVDSFGVMGVFENGVPICRAKSLPHPFLMKSGSFGDGEILLRLVDYIRQSEDAA